MAAVKVVRREERGVGGEERRRREWEKTWRGERRKKRGRD